jgi:hypothetical protein
MDVLSDTANAAMEVSCAYGYTTLMRCPRLGHANAVTPQGISLSLSLSLSLEREIRRIISGFQISHDR